MGIFTKKRTEPEKRAELERLLVAEFTARGITGELVRDPDDPLNTQLRHGNGAFGFSNVMILALPEPERLWKQIVRDHVHRMTSVQKKPDLRDSSTHDQLRARIMAEDVRPMIPVEYAKPFAAGLIEMLCLDLPETVTTLNDSDLAGLDLEAVRATARRNLRREPLERTQVAPGILLFGGPSFFVASQLLDPEFARLHLGATPRGYVAAIPDRHSLFVHVITGPESITAIGQLASFTSALDRDHRPGGFLSPHLYFLHDSTRQQITDYGPDAQLTIVADGAFLDAINEG